MKNVWQYLRANQLSAAVQGNCLAGLVSLHSRRTD